MAIKKRNGFSLAGHLNGTVCPPAQRFQKNVGAGADSVIYIGDPVSLSSAGTVTRLHASTSAAGAANHNYIGVCVGLFETEDGRPLTHRTNKYSATADSSWVDVVTDRDAVWEVSYGATANQTVLGTLSNAHYETPVTAAGISGAGLSSAATASGAALFRVIEVVNLQRDGANASNADQDGRVRVIINTGSHAYDAATGL